MTSDRPSGRDDAPRSPGHDPGSHDDARRAWDADDPQAWDEPESVRSGDAHGRESRDWQGLGGRDDDHLEHDEFGDDYGHYADDVEGLDDRHAHAATLLDDDERGRANRPAWRRVLVYALALAIVAGGVGIGWAALRPVYQHFAAPKDFEGPGAGSVTVVVEPGDTGLEIGGTLAEAGVVMTADAFADALADNPGDEIQPGHYTLRKGMASTQALSLLRSGERDELRVTVREGLWKSEVFAQLSKDTGVPLAEYTKAEEAIRKDPSLVGLPVSAKGAIEGYLFPATYAFDPGTNATTQLRQMVTNAMKQLRSLGVAPADMERVMTVASLVEAEARRDEDRPKVARVIENRLGKKMALQMDSSVNYAAQRRSITTSDQERASTSPYNTYRHPGLPPGPINNPGAESITAARKPADGPWLYFVTTDPGTGETRFAVTLPEHEANVKVFQQWCQSNPGKC